MTNRWYDGNNESVVHTDIGSDERPSYAIVQALAEVNDVNVRALDPLYEYVDLEALDQLIEHTECTDHTCRVELTIDDWLITISDDSSMVVRADDVHTE